MAIKRERDEGIAIAKAWGIILVVMGHCSFSAIQPGWQKSVHDFIYLFHIPLFFFLSGYFFKWKYLGDKRTFLKNDFEKTILTNIEKTPLKTILFCRQQAQMSSPAEFI